MPINYTDLFTRGGKLIKYINSRLARATTDLPAELKAIADLYETADLTGQIEGLYSEYDSMRDTVTEERETLAGYWDAILEDRPTVVDQLLLSSDSIDDILPALWRDMVANSQTIARSTVTLGSVTAASGNRGNGTVLLSKLLDGTNAPVRGGNSHLDWAGVDSELANPSETFTLTCVSDSVANGDDEGSERFTWDGQVATDAFGYLGEFSGSGPSMTTNGAGGRLLNGEMEDWNAANTIPNNWTLAAGVAGTNTGRESGGANIHRGTYSMRFIGNASAAAITLTQAMASRMRPRRLYCVTMRIRASAASGTGNFTAQFLGTGYTASSTERILINAGSMPTAAFTAAGSLFSFWIVTPAIIPSDWRLSLSNAGTPGVGSVWVDSVAVSEAVYHGGHAMVIAPGSSKWIVGDRLTYTVSNNGAGVFQEFFRRFYQFQLPSSGSPSIANSLAT